ncbi:transketolase [Shewanella sp.]|uniref:transketolase n=1 Tax=Shewanella sp. TaxID=50422 RepID=UPI003A98610A
MLINTQSIASKIRKDIIWSIYHARSGHPGGSLSCVDIVAVLFHLQMSGASPLESAEKDDVFILSKGHAVPTLYAAAASKNILPHESLKTLRKINSPLQGHPDVTQTPWVQVSTGSLGQGVSVATGIAKGFKLKESQQQVYALLGDGELQEGQVWEAAMFAAQHQLDNLTIIIDYNKLQSDARNSEICGLEPLRDKWTAFGCDVLEVDGHDHSALKKAFEVKHHNKPKVVIAHTIKGKGVDFMEDKPLWHGSVTLTTEQYNAAMRALGCTEAELEAYHNVK